MQGFCEHIAPTIMAMADNHFNALLSLRTDYGYVDSKKAIVIVITEPSSY